MTQPTREPFDLDEIIHQPSRLMIVNTLYAVEKADFLYLLREAGLTKGNLSAHLSKLEEAGYVAIEKMFEGKIPRTVCRLTDSGRLAYESYRDHMRQALNLT